MRTARLLLILALVIGALIAVALLSWDMASPPQTAAPRPAPVPSREVPTPTPPGGVPEEAARDRFAAREEKAERAKRDTGTRLAQVDPDLAAVDRVLRRLELANVAFNAPKTLWVREAGIIQLLLSAQQSIADLQGMMTAPGEKEGARVRISNEMEARLTGAGFKIEAITPEVQAVSASEVTEWKWEIEPTKPGSHRIHLTLSAHLQIEGQRVPRLIRTFERNIDVNVTWRQKASLFVAGNWQWLWTAVLVPALAWVIRRWRRGANNKKLEA